MRCRSDDSSIGARLGAFLVKFRRYGSGPADLVRITLKNGPNREMSALRQFRTKCGAAKASLFGHPADAREQRSRFVETECFCSLGTAVLGLQSWGCSLGANDKLVWPFALS
jgi:hypothetical protein